MDRYDRFHAVLPKLAHAIQISEEEILQPDFFRDFLKLVIVWLQEDERRQNPAYFV